MVVFCAPQVKHLHMLIFAARNELVDSLQLRGCSACKEPDIGAFGVPALCARGRIDSTSFSRTRYRSINSSSISSTPVYRIYQKRLPSCISGPSRVAIVFGVGRNFGAKVA